MKLKKYKKATWNIYLSRELIIIAISLAVSFFYINYLYRCFNHVIMPLAETKARKYLMEIINNGADNIKFENDLFAIEKSSNNEIKMINYNSYEATKLINQITHNIQNDFNKLEKNDNIAFDIPSGIVFRNALLRNIGPNIKIKLHVMGDVISELETEVKPYGINNALVEVRVKLSANVRVIAPLISKEITVTNVIPISINIINGKIPDAYIASYK